MKKLLFILAIGFCQLTVINCFAQAPNAIPYQGVARNAAGNIIASQPVSLRVSIHDLTAGGIVIYKETHIISTTALGLFNINIGSGTPITGTLAAVNWGSGAKFLQVEMDAAGGTAYADMGTTKLNSVPYALYAGNSGASNWTVSGNNIYNTNTGNVGIGTTAPASKLDVAGAVSIMGKLKIADGTEAAGRVLMSNGTGTASWTYPAAVMPSVNPAATTVSITTSNSSAFVVPAGVYSLNLEGVGGSGGGGGSGSAGHTNGGGLASSGPGGGGGGGEYGSMILNVNPGDIIGVTIGNAGNAGTGGIGTNGNGTAGTDGTATSITLNAAVVLTVNGGKGGNGGTGVSCAGICFGLQGSAGAGGTGSSAALVIPGTAGNARSGGGSAVVTNGISVTGGIGANSITVSGISTSNGSPGAAGSTGRVAISYFPAASAPTAIPLQKGSVIFAGNAGVLSSNNSKFYWDDTNGRLQVVGNIKLVDGNQAAGKVLTSDGGGFASWQYASGLAPGTAAGNTLYWDGSSWVNSSNIFNNGGDISIGSATPSAGYKLTVGGKVICTELKVQLQPFPDYVFEKSYNLRSLKEVEKHIKTYKRLPGMPSACEVESEGMSVGAMQGKVVEKVEELTLYIIQQQKEIDELKRLLTELKK